MSLQWSDWLEPTIPGILKPSETSGSMSKLRNNLWEQLTREIPTRVPVKNATHWSATVTLNGAVDLNHEFVLFLILVGKHDFSHHLPTIYPPFTHHLPTIYPPFTHHSQIWASQLPWNPPAIPCLPVRAAAVVVLESHVQPSYLTAVWKPLYGYGSIPMKIPFLVQLIGYPIHICSLGKYGYGSMSIPINTIFSGMNIHKSQLFWCEQKGYYWFWHTAIYLNASLYWSYLVWQGSHWKLPVLPHW